ncbi:MAG: penicillin-binding transpeptidase domain-containing protein [Dissulfurimicrobium sp.]|uniref:penicillin-binding transpeptidase domain-containing protein n=1 Tax=Dissulfurimicrobium sp. TaxID=2022436 RepID=UPI00404B120B
MRRYGYHQEKKRKGRITLPFVLTACVIAISVTLYFAWPIVRELGVKRFFRTAASNTDSGGIYIDSGVERARIFDRSGTVLATNNIIVSVYARPSLLPLNDDWIATVSGILGIPQEEIKQKVSMTRNFVWLKTGIRDAEAVKLNAAHIPGIGVAETFKRFYPYRDLATQVLGFVDQNGMGLEGVESFYNNRLSAKKCNGPQAPDCSLHLTIERGVQLMAQEELRSELSKMRGEEGCLILMGLDTGQILAMAISPSWDADRFWQNDQTGFSNYAIRAEVDPSIFFLFTNWIASARSSSKSNNANGSFAPDIQTEGFDFVHINDKFSVFGPWTSQEIKSANFNENMLKDMWGLGFGQLTGIDLPNEDMGRLPSNPPYSWDDLLVQGMTASPVQMLRAFCALINRGKLVQPHVAFEYPKKDRTLYWDCGLQTVKNSVPVTEEATLKFRIKLSQPDGAPVFTIKRYDETRGSQIAAIGFWPIDAPVIGYIVVLDRIKEDPKRYIEVFGGIKKVVKAAARLPLDIL